MIAAANSSRNFGRRPPRCWEQPPTQPHRTIPSRRVGVHRCPLQSPYQGPFKMIDMQCKFYKRNRLSCVKQRMRLNHNAQLVQQKRCAYEINSRERRQRRGRPSTSRPSNLQLEARWITGSIATALSELD